PEEGEGLDHAFRAQQSIAAAIETPGTAERAVPRTPARKFDRPAGIQHADEIFMALAHTIARRADDVEVFDECQPRTRRVRGADARQFSEGAAVARNGLKQLDDGCLALALEHTIDRALAMLHNGLCGEGGAVATNADEGARQTTFGNLCQIDDLGHIGEVVA